MRGSRVAVGPFSDFFLGRLDFSALCSTTLRKVINYVVPNV